MLSKENLEDRKLAENFLPRLRYISLDEKLTFDEKIDRVIETRMSGVKNEFPHESSEIHKKYPDAGFWLYVMML